MEERDEVDEICYILSHRARGNRAIFARPPSQELPRYVG